MAKVFISGIPHELDAKKAKGEHKAGHVITRIYCVGKTQTCWVKHRIDRDDPAIETDAEVIGDESAALWLAKHGCEVPKELWGHLRGRFDFDADGRPIISAKPKRQRKRRRQSTTPTTPLTAAQTEALQLVGEHKGNITAAAAAGKSRQAMKKLYEKALKKLGKRNTDKIKTHALPVNARGQQDTTDRD